MENNPEVQRTEDTLRVVNFPIIQEAAERLKSPAIFTGPISGPMWKQVSELGSRYPDTFDWSMYDRLFDRFGEKQPRGGVTFKTTFKLANNHASCSKCHYAFEIDTYGRGCVHNCSYCYAKLALSAHGYWNRPMPFPIDLSDVRRTFFKVFETSKPDKWRDVLEKKVPLRIGSMSDAFMWMDKTYKVTQELLKILSYYDYPYIIFTRSDLVATDDYIKLLRRDLGSIQFSICGNNEMLTKVVEPGAPSVKRRLNALKTLAENGFHTAVRLNPLFPTYPDGYFTDRDRLLKQYGSQSNIPKLQLFDIDASDEFIKVLKEHRVSSVLAGVVRMSARTVVEVSKSTGVNYREFFRPEEYASTTDKRFSDAEVAYYYKAIHRGCIRNGIRFSTCYIGNGIKDFYQYQNLWSNKSLDCCDALGSVKAFKTSSQDLTWEVRAKHSPSDRETQRAMEIEQTFERSIEQKPIRSNKNPIEEISLNGQI